MTYSRPMKFLYYNFPNFISAKFQFFQLARKNFQLKVLTKRRLNIGLLKRLKTYFLMTLCRPGAWQYRGPRDESYVDLKNSQSIQIKTFVPNFVFFEPSLTSLRLLKISELFFNLIADIIICNKNYTCKFQFCKKNVIS